MTATREALQVTQHAYSPVSRVGRGRRCACGHGPRHPVHLPPPPKPKTPRSVAVPAATYQQLRELARWVQATPGFIELYEGQIDRVQGAYSDMLDHLLPDSVAVVDVETGLGCGLVAVVDSEDGVEVRVRLRNIK